VQITPLRHAVFSQGDNCLEKNGGHTAGTLFLRRFAASVVIDKSPSSFQQALQGDFSI
jgi:hypothetical protein